MADDADPATFSERFPETIGNVSQQQAEYAAQGLRNPAQEYKFIAGTLGTMAAGTAETIAGLFTKTRDAFFNGLTPSQEVEVGANAALTQIGSGEAFKIPKGTAAAFDNFHEQVVKPLSQHVVSAATPEPPKNTDVPANVPRSQLALTGEAHIDAVLNHPVLKNVIDNPIIDRTHEIPNSWGGSLPLDNPVTYVDKDFPRALTVDGKVFDPAEGAAVHENIEEAVIQRLMDNGMSRDASLRAAYWGWGNPAEHAWYSAHGMDPNHVEAAIKPYLDQIAARKPNPANIPSDLFKETYPDGNPLKDIPGTIDKPSDAELAQAKKIIADWNPAEEQVQPEKPPTVNPLQQARELGVIGPERVDNPQDSPAVAAQRAIPANMRQGDKITETPAGEPIDAYQQRFKEWISKIKAPGDIDNLIAEAAAENNYFPTAREGEIPAAHIEELARASGFDSTKFDRALLRKRFNSDDEIRAAEQVLLQTRDDYREAIQKARSNPSEENILSAVDAKRRHQYALEYVSAFRSDWGKSGLAQQEFLARERRREQYRERGSNGVPKEPNDLIDATDDFSHAPTKSGLEKLIASAQKAVDAAKPKEGAEPKAPPPAGVSELVKNAEDVLKRFGSGARRTELDKLIASAERTAGPRKAAAQRAVAQQLPPELQALVDKAERVTKRFGGIDRAAAEIKAEAEATQGLDKEGFSYVTARAWQMFQRAGKYVPDWLFWLRNNWLLSGPITHTFYFGVNTGTMAAEHIFTPMIAAAFDKVVGGRSVFFGEPFSALLGMGHAVPGALRSSWQAARTGLRVPLESELRLAARGEESPQATGAQIPYLAHSSPDWGSIKAAADWLGVPMKARSTAELVAGGAFGRFANLQHTFFKVLNEGAQAHRNAYVATVKEGLSPLSSAKFQDRYTYHLKNPTDDVLRDNVNAGYSGTFMEKLGDKTQRLASALKDTPLRWEFPFLHVPLNIERRGISYSPLAVFGKEMMAQLMGERGARPQALAIARVAGGTAVLGYVLNLALQNKVTGDYPTNPKERQRWKLENIQPNSVQIGDEWVSFNRFGPARIPMTIGANIGQIIAHRDVKADADTEMANLIGSGVSATVHALSDEVGFLALHNLFEAMEGGKSAAQFGAEQVSSFMPYNVGMGQLAAYNDPYMREVRSVSAGIEYKSPWGRQDLPPKRDPLYGTPIPNPAYHSFVRSSPVNKDYAKSELDRIDYYPTAPANHIGGVKLSPEQYDKYEATAGPLVNAALNGLVRSPQWQAHNGNPEWQKQVAKSVISQARRKAAGAMQMDDPSLIEAGRQRRLSQINGR